MVVRGWHTKRLVVSGIIVMGLAAVLFSAAPHIARAQGFGPAYNGYYPWQVAGCLSHNVRAGQGSPDPVASLWTDTTYYGWAEQRYSYSGDCNGYQWIRLHVTTDIYLYNRDSRLQIREWPMDGSGDEYPMGPEGVKGHFRPGTYDLPLLYVTYHQICAQVFYAITFDNEELFFGHNHRAVNDWYPGMWCA